MKKVKNYSLNEALFSFFPLYPANNYFQLMLEGAGKIIGYNHLPVIIPNRLRIYGEKGYTIFLNKDLKFVSFENVPSWEDYSESRLIVDCCTEILNMSQSENLPIVWVFGTRNLMFNLAYEFSKNGYLAHYHCRDTNDRQFIIVKKEKLVAYPLSIMPAYANAS